MNIDFKKLFIQLLHPRLRRAKLLISITDSIGSVLNAWKADFDTWISKTRYEIGITPQVCYLEKVLNDTFDSSLRRITISEPARVPTQYMYRKTDLKDFYFENTYFIDDSRFGYIYDFYVNIPIGLIYSNARLINIVNKYKLAGKTFLIKEI
ncbi:MAG: uncharacterized protein H6Q15_1770 [Bacteroidetes bacterium]|nr:uncharacterized protein [Bacteroidota bacterium]